MIPYRIGLRRRHFHHRDHGCVRLAIGFQLADARPIADDDVIGQDHRERLVADQSLAIRTACPRPSCSF